MDYKLNAFTQRSLIKIFIFGLLVVCSLLLVAGCQESGSTGNPAIGASDINGMSYLPDSSGYIEKYWAVNDTTRWKQPAIAGWPSGFGFGRSATTEQIRKLDIDIMPDGSGLPAGEGSAGDGYKIFQVKCAVCHGTTGREGPNNRLVAAITDTAKEKTIGNYWPYSTTVFDYVRRSMPLNAPGSLTNQEVYNLTAWLLFANGIIDSTAVVNASNLAKINMPAKKYYVNDDRKGGDEVR